MMILPMPVDHESVVSADSGSAGAADGAVDSDADHNYWQPVD